ncbi:hypothetical protein HMPREF3113_09725 [Stenotrophomonas sp. HMSC10F06]|nr:hypothetical protein HMPREF3113_09725 [Stenotrophomonas sp. HMSC10F06]
MGSMERPAIGSEAFFLSGDSFQATSLVIFCILACSSVFDVTLGEVHLIFLKLGDAAAYGHSSGQLI